MGAREGSSAAGADRPGHGSVRLAAELENVAVGRRWLHGRLEDDGVQHSTIADLLQSLSEALTNAILYGDGLHVRIEYAVTNDTAKVSVFNGVRDGAEPQRRGPVGPDAENGRGLDLVEAFSDRWGIATSENEAKVWFEVKLP
ncbi:ATP-binding protein [Actinomadura algeriensis]|uniref:Anti-sigma regulatory factor (Ser/Thr protein kinase) n=1 Tax=Actinomadura algeriensis TaxID=1679523 RepID=A0ABR9JNN7_9ACTN|nr:ATP-binding protein [Actinomadura algeriensis]MBE1532123.1 anti-sigma regulatory factor (Ser/Thr protein kinase) [Actinomadura algeriensis]